MDEQIGFLRLPQVLKIFPVSRSTFLTGVRTQRYPVKAYKLGPRMTAYKKSDIVKLCEEFIAGAEAKDNLSTIVDKKQGKDE